MNYDESLNRLKKIVSDLGKEEKEVASENEKSEAEINEIRRVASDRIAKIISAKKKKLKTKETKIGELQSEKMQIIGGIFMMYSQGKITKEELDKVSKLEEEIKSQSTSKNDSSKQDDQTSDNTSESN